MPKQRITKQMVVDAAFEIVRSQGMEQVMVKSIAEKLHCSVQPIYSYCTNMESLREEVAQKAREFVRDYVAARIDPADMFRSTGHAHLRLADEEPHIFRIFITRQRKNVASLEELYASETSPHVAGAIAKGLGISPEKARQLHLNMMIYNIGMGAILSASAIPAGEMEHQLEEAYLAFLHDALEEEK